jgi:hypothetical protein
MRSVLPGFTGSVTRVRERLDSIAFALAGAHLTKQKDIHAMISYAQAGKEWGQVWKRRTSPLNPFL